MTAVCQSPCMPGPPPCSHTTLLTAQKGQGQLNEALHMTASLPYGPSGDSQARPCEPHQQHRATPRDPKVGCSGGPTNPKGGLHIPPPCPTYTSHIICFSSLSYASAHSLPGRQVKVRSGRQVHSGGLLSKSTHKTPPRVRYHHIQYQQQIQQQRHQTIELRVARHTGKSHTRDHQTDGSTIHGNITHVTIKLTVARHTGTRDHQQKSTKHNGTPHSILQNTTVHHTAVLQKPRLADLKLALGERQEPA